MSKALVYIAGPYSTGDQVINTRKIVQIGMRLHEDTGAGIIIPHLTMLAHAMFPQMLNYWYEYDLAILEHCTHLLRIEGYSIGADKEVEKARELGIPTYFGEFGEKNLTDELKQEASTSQM